MKGDPKEGQLLQCVMQNATESTRFFSKHQERLVSKSSRKTLASEKKPVKLKGSGSMREGENKLSMNKQRWKVIRRTVQKNKIMEQFSS